MVPRERLALREPKATREASGPKGARERRDWPDRQGLKACRAQPARKVLREHRASEVRRETPVSPAPPAPREPRDSRALRG